MGAFFLRVHVIFSCGYIQCATYRHTIPLPSVHFVAIESSSILNGQLSITSICRSKLYMLTYLII